MHKIKFSTLRSILDLNSYLGEKRQSLIILNCKCNFIFNSSVAYNNEHFFDIIREAVKKAPDFVDRLIKKYFDNLPETFYEAVFEIDNDYEIIDVVDLANVNYADQCKLNDIKEYYASIYNAKTREAEKVQVSFRTPEVFKYLAQLIVWYDYLSLVEAKLPFNRSKRVNAEVVIMYRQNIRKVYGSDKSVFDRSFSNFIAHLRNWFNCNAELQKIPRLLTDVTSEKNRKLLPFSFELGIKLRPNADYNHVRWDTSVIRLENAGKGIYALDQLCFINSQKPLFK